MLVQSQPDAAGPTAELGVSGTALRHYSFRCREVGPCSQTLLLLLKAGNAYSFWVTVNALTPFGYAYFLMCSRMLFEAWTRRFLYSALTGLPALRSVSWQSSWEWSCEKILVCWLCCKLQSLVVRLWSKLLFGSVQGVEC